VHPHVLSGPSADAPRPSDTLAELMIPSGRVGAVGSVAEGIGAEGATAPETLRLTDRTGEATLESSPVRPARRRGKPGSPGESLRSR